MILKNLYNCLVTNSNVAPSKPKNFQGNANNMNNLLSYLSSNYNYLGFVGYSTEQTITYDMSRGATASEVRGWHTGGEPTFIEENGNLVIIQTVTYTATSEKSITDVGYFIDTSSSFAAATSVLLHLEHLSEPITVPAGSTIAVTFKFTIGGNPIV